MVIGTILPKIIIAALVISFMDMDGMLKENSLSC